MLDKNLSTEHSINIYADVSAVWDLLCNPEKIKMYLYGTETITDWQIGSAIVFQGEYNGQNYKDKGKVLENISNKKISYSYWSGFSGLEDKPENYFLVSYILDVVDDNKVILTWKQSGFKNQESLKHTEDNLPAMLKQMKEIAENS